MSPKQPAVPAFMDLQPRLGPAGVFSFPRPHTFKLANGVRVLLLEKHDLPLVNLRLTLPAGITQEPAGQPGVAYVTGQMLMEGAGKRSALQLSSSLLDLGASLRSYVDEDHAAVSLQVLRKHLGVGMDILADVLTRPRLTAKDFKRVKGELWGRALQRRARPAQVAYLVFKAALFGGHAYGRPLLPAPKELAPLTLDQVRAFHRQVYTPQGAVIVAAGDINPAELKKLLEERLSHWTGVSSARQVKQTTPPRQGPRLVLVDRPGATQSVLRVGHLAPSQRSADQAGLRVLNTILGGSFTSRLNQNLREKHGFTYGVRSHFALLYARGLFSISTTVETKNTAATLREMFRELEILTRKPVSKRELSKAARLVIEDLPEQAETNVGLVAAYSEVAAHGLPLVSLTRLAGEVDAMDPASLVELARKVLRPGQISVVVVGDLQKFQGELQKTYGEAQIRDSDGEVVSRNK